MYSEEVIKLATDALADDTKSTMVVLSKSDSNLNKILSETSWMNSFYKDLPLKIRCITIVSGYDKESYPKCNNCGNPTGYDKEYNNSFNRFCGDKCSKTYGRLSDNVREKLYSHEWMYDKRVKLGLSFRSIGKLLGISDFTVIKSCKNLGI